MSGNEESENQGFKVNDRRRFQADGSPSEGAAEPNSSNESPITEEPPPTQSEGLNREILPAEFSSLVLSLAAGAQSALGIAPHPMTGKIEKNLPHARYSIDLLGVLAEKTKGNLNSEEEKLLQTLLYDLRVRYLEASQGGK